MNPTFIHNTEVVVTTVVAVLGGSYGLHKHFFSKLKSDLPGVMKIGGDIVKAGEDILGVPGMEGVKAAMGVEVHHVENELQHSQILQTVGSVLHAFGKDVSQLSQNEKGGIVTLASSELQKLGISVDAKTITHAMDEFQKAADGIRKTGVFTNLSALEDAIKQLTATPQQNAKDAATTKEPAETASTKSAAAKG
ncbi:hypothetical protein [Alicyclobacillus sp. SO9]|uniref:hypothetical protein n=1 Tax=Alicyclobacillus sp. SO9 TaxID=2665646 RepID=UPI0018E6ECF0|nr:hypothetical protein [Alicyclobacillus sp. SO9]QQE80947.1 hypothetical protein GI364_11480 [Alicyclobacillus sp. SO9]